MKFIKYILILATMLLISTTSLQAKWWIFGGGEDEVGFDYLYVNSLSFDDVTEKAILPTQQLDKGLLHVRGKGRAGKNNIGAISVSIDGGKSWNKTSFEKDGGFDYTFTPDISQSYDIYVKIIDTTGKANELADSHILISFQDLDVQTIIKDVLTQLKSAYEQEDDMAFMRFVSPSFEGDSATLERALRKDFSVLDNITIDFSLTSVAFSNNRYYASIYFNRSVRDALNGTSYDDKGVTEFAFTIGEEGAMLLSMKNPLIFGLTYAGDIASGTTASAQNSDNFLTITDGGSVSETSLANIESGSSGSDYMTSGSFYLQELCAPGPGCTTTHGFNFSNDGVANTFDEAQLITETNLLGWNGTLMKKLGNVGMSGITAPNPSLVSYDGFIDWADLSTGDVIAIKLSDNTFAIIQYEVSVFPQYNFTYKYNPDGSRIFP